MNKKKLIEAKKLLQKKLRLIENELATEEKDRMEQLAGISEDDGYYSPTSQDEEDFETNELQPLVKKFEQSAAKMLTSPSFELNKLIQRGDEDAIYTHILKAIVQEYQ